MRKNYLYVFISVLLLLYPFVLPTSVSAQDEDDEDNAIGGTGRSAFTKIRLGAGDTVEAIAGNLAPPQPFNIIGDVISLVTKKDEHNYIDMTPFHTWLGGSPFVNLMPGYFTLVKPYVPFTTAQTGSAHYGAILRITGRDIFTFVSDCFLTNDHPPEQSNEIPSRKELYQDAQYLGSLWSGYKIKANSEGTVVFDKPNFVVKRIDPADCGRFDPNVEREPLISDVTKRAYFAEGSAQSSVIESIVERIWNEIKKIFELVPETLGVNLSVELTQKLKTSGNVYFALLGYGFGARELTDAITEHSRTPNDGIFGSLVAYAARKNPIGFAGTQNEINIAGNVTNTQSYISREVGANRGYESMQQGACPIYSYQIIHGKGPVPAGYKIGGEIPIAPACAAEIKKPVQCPIDVIAEENPPSKDSSCGLCSGGYTSSNSYLTNLEKQAFPSGVPPLLTKVLTYVGGLYHVPPAVLLGTMLEEGSFGHAPTWTWTNDTVKKYSDCTVQSPMPSCDSFAHPGTGAKGPFGFIQNWWDQYMQSGGPYKAVENDPLFKDVLSAMPKENIGPCNFVDAAFMAARELGEDQSHLYVSGLPASCSTSLGEISVYQGNDRPASCSVWNNERVVLSRLQYGDRVCDSSIDRMVRTFDGLNCGGN